MKTRTQTLKASAFVLGLAVFAALVSIFWWDSLVSNYFMKHQYYHLRVYARAITDIGDGTQWFVLSAVVYILSKWILPRLRYFSEKTLLFYRRLAAFSFLSLTFVGICIQLLKHLIGRGRPHTTANFESINFDPLNTHWHWHSLPSGHSQVLFVLAAILSIYIPRYKLLFIGLAAALALTRVITHQHFLSDIILGAAIGYVGTHLVHLRFR